MIAFIVFNNYVNCVGSDNSSNTSETSSTNSTDTSSTNNTANGTSPINKGKNLKQNIVKVNLTAEITTLDLQSPSEPATTVSVEK